VLDEFSFVARVKAGRLLVYVCASALRFKRASAAEHHYH
jgi:hypothetical protein